MPKGGRMGKCLTVILICIATLPAAGQAPSSQYEPGAITAVTAHRTPGQPEADVTQYDVSVRVGNTSYVVLFTPTNGSNTVKYSVGIERLVLVGSDTLTFNDAVAGKIEVPILSRTTIPAQSLDWTRVCGQYFSLKLQHLTEILALSDNQQAEIKPIVEQETAEVGEICFNPVLSRDDTLKQYEKILRASDAKIKPLLSATQLQKLQDLRKGQKQDAKKIIADLKIGKPETPRQ